MLVQELDSQRAAESPGAVVRVRAVVEYEDVVVAAVSEHCSAEFSDIRRCFHPA